MSKKILLRKFPYPYKAALTILNDRHSIHSVEDFLEVRRFLNTTCQTRFGSGLNLEIGDTFWFYGSNGQFNYFRSHTFEKTEAAEVIIDFARAGYLDALHTYGDFSEILFDRKYAEAALDELREQSLKVHTWVHHGNSKNTQNISPGLVEAYSRGARRGAAEYHADILGDYGIRFAWVAHLTRIVGQERTLAISEAMAAEGKEGIRLWYECVKGYMKELVSRIMELSGSSPKFYMPWRDNRLLFPVMLDDGQRVYAFRRFNNYPGNIWRGVDCNDIARQISIAVLEKLKHVEGYSIVYHHLEHEFPYNEESLQALRNLSKEFHSGNIFITTSTRLLIYLLVTKFLRWEEVRLDSANCMIRIEPELHDEVFGSLLLTEDWLQGVTFYTSDSINLSIVLGEQNIPVVRNPPDHTGKGSYQIPFQPLKFPAKYLQG